MAIDPFSYAFAPTIGRHALPPSGRQSSPDPGAPAGSGVAAGDRSAGPTANPGHSDGPPAVPEFEPSFNDVLDLVNPLQHLPLIGTLYREITGDTISPPMRVMGGILFGGVLGGVSAAVNAIVEQDTGKDIAGNVYAALFDPGDASAAPSVMTAALPAGAAAPRPDAAPASPRPDAGAASMSAADLMAVLPGTAVSMRGEVQVAAAPAARETGRSGSGPGRPTVTDLRRTEPPPPPAPAPSPAEPTAAVRPGGGSAGTGAGRAEPAVAVRPPIPRPSTLDRRFRTTGAASAADLSARLAVERSRGPRLPNTAGATASDRLPTAAGATATGRPPAPVVTPAAGAPSFDLIVGNDRVADAMVRNLWKYETMQQQQSEQQRSVADGAAGADAT